MEPAVTARHIGKQYRIGVKERTGRTLRETIVDMAVAPFRRLGRIGNAYGSEELIWALKDVSFDVQPGEVVGIIGRNGAGKSTLLKILSRITEPTEGTIKLHGRVASLLEVGTGFHPELTGRENMYLNGTILGMKKAEIDRKFDEIVAFSEIEKFLDTPVKHYSSGMYVRLAFAVAAHLNPEILLVDEVLAVGDAAFQKKCLAKIGEVSKAGRTVLFVSHNMAAVERLCSRAIVLRDGRLADDQAAPAAVVGYLQVTAMTEDHGLAYQVRRELLSAHVDPDMRFTDIELMTVSEAPLQHCGTGDSILIRMHYEASRQFASQAFAIHARNHLGQAVFRLNTTPISGYPIERLASRGHVDLVLESLPLTAGRYYFDIGFVRERTEWIIKLEDVVELNIGLHDVYGSGMAIDSSRGMIVVSHRWRHYDANNERELAPSAPGQQDRA